MASIKLGPVVTDARGSVAGTTFSRGPFGHYMKQRVVPVNPGTAKQVAARSLLSVHVDGWSSALTTAQRDEWNSAVQNFTVPNRLGDPVHLTGLQWYVRCNCLLSLTAQTPVLVPPIVPIVPAPTLTLTWTTTVGITCTAIGDWDETAADALLAYRSDDLSLTKNFWKGPWTDSRVEAGSDYTTLPYTMIASADLVANSRVFQKLRVVNDDGANSFPIILPSDVGSPA